jgi:aspartate-semialdehyde dehydrogenase
VEVSYADRTLRCEDFEQFDFSRADIVLMSAGADLSRAHAERIGRSAAVVIDNSSAWRMHPEVPLVVPEVNPDAAEGFRRKGIIANPNCSTIQLVTALKPLHDEARIKRVVVSTYQSVSGAGKDGMDELFEQTKGVFVLGPSEPKHFTKQIAFNLIPHIDDFLPDGSTKEEWKMTAETQKILDPAILREAPGVQVLDKREDGGYITPKEAAGEHAVFVSRIRRDPTVEHGLNLWVVSDNLRKGAALNAVQIAQLLDERGLIETRAAA